MSLMERFESHFIPEPMTGCWIWIGAINKGGYGLFLFRDRKPQLAHRVAWILAKGEIPNRNRPHDTCILHKCDNPPCVNPSHLFLGSQADNNRNARKKNRANIETARKARIEQQRNLNYCKHGHSFSNCFIFNGKRQCRECNRQRCLRNYYAEKRMAEVL